MRHFLFPLLLKPICEHADGLYFHGNGPVIPGNGSTDLGTYFNQLSVGKFRTYTCIDTFYLLLELRGSGTVTLWGGSSGNAGRVLMTRTFDMPEHGSLEMPVTPEVYGICDHIWVSVSSDTGCEVVSGRYEAETDGEPKDIRLGIVICTYRREEYLLRNLHAMNSYFTGPAPWSDRFELFCVDNANTLTPEAVCLRPGFHLLPNKNYGGSGGFTRGMMELTVPGSRFTHAYFMDDDIVFEPSVLQRILSFLSFVRDEYADAFLPLGMLDLDDPVRQCENTACYTGTTFRSNRKDLDLSEQQALTENEKEMPADYAGWWSLVFPLRNVGPDDLSLPFFIKLDDAEFGMRLMKRYIPMNGFGVWHAGFSGKSSAWQEYYVTRNGLILLALYPDRLRTGIRRFLAVRLIKALSAGSEQSMDAVLTGVRDYAKGAEWLMSCHPDELHHELMAALNEKTVYPASSKLKILKAIGNIVTPAGIRICGRYFRSLSMIRENRDAALTYRANKDRMISRKFWTNYMA